LEVGLILRINNDLASWASSAEERVYGAMTL
jgi:hypothetical protein